MTFSFSKKNSESCSDFGFFFVVAKPVAVKPCLPVRPFTIKSNEILNQFPRRVYYTFSLHIPFESLSLAFGFNNLDKLLAVLRPQILLF